MPPCSVLTYQTPAGNAPVDEYISGLEGTAATKAAALVKLLESLGHELRLRLRALQAAVNAELKKPKKGR